MQEMNNSVLEISFTSSKWDYIKGTREFIKEYLALNSLKNEDISKVIIAASELLENALKYSTNGKVYITLRKDLNRNTVTITVANPAADVDMNKLNQIIGEMEAAANPLSYYVSRMRNKGTHSIRGGGLGLARVRSEADAALSANFNSENSQLSVTALLKF